MKLRFVRRPNSQPFDGGLLRGAAALTLAVVAVLGGADVETADAKRRLGVTITSKPPDPSSSSSATFEWSTSGTVTTTTCSLDGSAPTACASGKTYSGLANGAHSFTVRVANSTSSASATASWTVEVPATPPPGTALWAGDMEEGALADWYAPSTTATGDYGGGEFNSGSGATAASSDVAHTGTWSTKMSLSDGVGGARLFRWRELRAKRTTKQSTWMYIPRNYTLTGDPTSGRYWILFQFKSRNSDNSRNDPFWYVNAYNRSDGSIGARLAWGYQSRLEGPHVGEFGWRNYGDVGVPVGRWFKIESTLTQSKDFDGAISVTIDGQPLASVTSVRTGWPNCTFNLWCVEQHWAVTNYSDGIAEIPSTIYVDDAEVAEP